MTVPKWGDTTHRTAKYRFTASNHALKSPTMTTTTLNLDTLITLDELCERAKITKSGFRTIRQQGKAPKGYKIGRRIYFDPADADAWLASRVREAR